VTDGMIRQGHKLRGRPYQTLVQDAVTHPVETHLSANYVNKVIKNGRKVVTFYNCKN